MWEWFSKTSLSGQLPGVSESCLTSQHFFNHANLIEDCKIIWELLIKGVVDQEKIDLSSISYDGTNFYTFINTFNVRCSIAKRGKNKQGRANLRQVNYSLFCASDSHMPLHYDVYDGNRNDYTQFPEALEHFEIFFEKLSNSAHIKEQTTLVFDKGNCSADNFERIDQ
jgi:transposase